MDWVISSVGALPGCGDAQEPPDRYRFTPRRHEPDPAPVQQVGARLFSVACHVVSVPTVRVSAAGWRFLAAYLCRPRCAENARTSRKWCTLHESAGETLMIWMSRTPISATNSAFRLMIDRTDSAADD